MMTAPTQIVLATDFSPSDLSSKVGVIERVRSSWDRIAAAVSLIAILLHLIFQYGFHNSGAGSRVPLWIAIVAGGLPLLYGLSLPCSCFRCSFFLCRPRPTSVTPRGLTAFLSEHIGSCSVAAGAAEISSNRFGDSPLPVAFPKEVRHNDSCGKPKEQLYD